jgi:hypothetical protein
LARNRSYITLAKWLIAIGLIALIAPATFAQVHALNVYRRADIQNPFRKGLFVEADVILEQSSPSMSSLVAAHFTIVGVDFTPACFSTGKCTEPIANWLDAAKAAGLHTYIIVWGSYPTVLSYIPTLRNFNIDYVDLDEPLSTGNWTISQLQSFISAASIAFGKSVNFIVNEYRYDSDPFPALYALEIPNLFVSEDNYDQPHQSTISYNIQLGQQYGKPAIAWLAFAPAIKVTDCYLNFSSWIAYAKQLNANVFFYLLDSQVPHSQQDWSLVASY